MNYEYMVAPPRKGNRINKIHIVISGAATSLCGRRANRQKWRSVERNEQVQCSMCADQLRRITKESGSASPRIITIKPTPRQYEILICLRNGMELAEIDQLHGKVNGVTFHHLQRVCAAHGVTIPEMRAMLPYVHIVDPDKQRREPSIYKQPCGTYRVHYYDEETRAWEYLWTWATEDEARAAWNARDRGRPVPKPQKQTPKGYYRDADGTYRVFIYDRATKKKFYGGRYQTEPEVIAAVAHARKHGIYTPKGLVKIAQES